MKKSALISSLAVCLIALGVLFWYSSDRSSRTNDRIELTKSTIELEVKELNEEWLASVKSIVKNTSEATARFVFSIIYH